MINLHKTEGQGMMDYDKLVKTLRSASTVSTAWEKLMHDAAAAIEALDRLLDQNTQRREALRKQLREAHESYEKHLNELEAQLPKRGKWIVHTEVKNIYGGICIECLVCRDHFVVLNVSDEKYCRSCGAKMEVQE